VTRVLVIVPAYDEEESLPRTLAELRAEADAAGVPLPVPAANPVTATVDEHEDDRVDEIELEPADEADDVPPVVLKSAQAGPVPGEGVSVGETGARKPHRRRGRRGGRRNRPGNRGPRDENNSSGAEGGADNTGEGA
jgi:hypothetical protein